MCLRIFDLLPLQIVKAQGSSNQTSQVLHWRVETKILDGQKRFQRWALKAVRKSQHLPHKIEDHSAENSIIVSEVGGRSYQ